MLQWILVSAYLKLLPLEHKKRPPLWITGCPLTESHPHWKAGSPVGYIINPLKFLHITDCQWSQESIPQGKPFCLFSASLLETIEPLLRISTPWNRLETYCCPTKGWTKPPAWTRAQAGVLKRTLNMFSSMHNTPHPTGNSWAIQQCLWLTPHLMWPVSQELLISIQLRLQSYGQLQQRNKDWMSHSSGPLINFYYWSLQRRGRTVQGRELFSTVPVWVNLIPHSCQIDGYLSSGSKFMPAGKPASVTTTIQANPKKGEQHMLFYYSAFWKGCLTIHNI